MTNSGQNKKLITYFLDRRTWVRRERENLFNDWLLNEELQERWRIKVLTALSYVFLSFAIVNSVPALKIYLDHPDRQNWQFALLHVSILPWTVLMILAWRAARARKPHISINLMLFAFFIGPPGLASIGLEGFSRFYNSPLLLLTIIFISILSQRRSQYVLISISIAAWFAMIMLQFIFYRNSVTVPVPELLAGIGPGMVFSTVAFYLVMILQFHRLSVPSKVLLSVMTSIQIIYLIVLGYSGWTLVKHLPAAEIEDYLRGLQFILEFTLGGVALAILIMTRVISGPLTRLMDTALKIQEGDLSARVSLSSIDEIGELSKVFNQTTARLEETLNGLEHTVADRTRDLEIAIGVSKQITQVLRLEELLPQLVENTRDGFGLYFVSVYLYDNKNRQLVLSAGTGEAGQLMKRDGKVFDIDAQRSIVAQAAREQQAVVTGNVSQSRTHLANPYLPDTNSEAAIPMIVQGELVGVLGLQSKEVNKFRAEDIRILTSLAEQIGVAVKNARLYEEQLIVAEELKHVDQMKSQFLSSMSHELRTPLNAIINFVEMTAKGMIGPVNQEQEDLLNHTLNSSKHLLHLINDVLDISKIQAGRLSLFLEDQVDLHEEIEAVLDMVKGLAREKRLQLIRDVDWGLPLVSCDRRRVRQVLLNLLGNAIKFTDQGTITLGVKNHAGEVQFAVIDTGPGIPPAEQELIFEPFMQAKDDARLTPGTGLGLPISRSLVRAHGGELWLESEEGKGSTFFFTLPVRIPVNQ